MKNQNNNDSLKKNRLENFSSPLKGKYLVKNPLLFTFLKSMDFLSFVYFKILKLDFFKSKKRQINEKTKLENFLKNPKKILLSNIAHLGDVLISLKAASIIKQKFPNVQIGFVCSTASRQIVESFSLINKIYLVDHYKLNRDKISKLKKIKNYFISKKHAVHEIRKQNYNLAIDLHYHFPNSIHLLYKTKIPIRIGYSSAGFENFLTHKINWQEKNQHVSLYHLDLLKFLNLDQNLFKTTNHFFSKDLLNKYKNQKQLKDFDLPRSYIVIHIGAGSEKKMWDILNWKKLTQKLLEKKENLVFTGKGENEKEKILEIINSKNNFNEKSSPLFFDENKKNNFDQKKLFNLCNKLNFLELCSVVKNAKLVICVDSLMLHIATYLNKSTIIIYSGINNFNHWVEKKQNVIPIIKKMDCNPCCLKNGCKSMGCLNKIKIEDILAKMEFLKC